MLLNFNLFTVDRQTLTHQYVMFEVTTSKCKTKVYSICSWKSANLVAGFCAARPHGEQPQACRTHSKIS